MKVVEMVSCKEARCGDPGLHNAEEDKHRHSPAEPISPKRVTTRDWSDLCQDHRLTLSHPSSCPSPLLPVHHHLPILPHFSIDNETTTPQHHHPCRCYGTCNPIHRIHQQNTPARSTCKRRGHGILDWVYQKASQTTILNLLLCMMPSIHQQTSPSIMKDPN